MKLLLPVLALVCAVPRAQAADPWQDASPHRSGLVEAIGVRLHYLDWGGSGDAMVFLAGLGNTAHVFDTLAPKFTQSSGKTPAFRAIGMTRRGFGQSDRPDTGYDVPARVADLAAFLDAMKIPKAVLVGHSLAGDELTAFAMAHPARVIKLVYLDAAYDRSRLPAELLKAESAMMAAMLSKLPKLPPEATLLERTIAGGKARFGNLWNESLEAEAREGFVRAADGSLKPRPIPPVPALREGTVKAKLDYAKLASPALSLFAISSIVDDLPAEKRAEFQDVARVFSEYQQSSIAALKNNSHAQVVVYPGANHYCWFDRGDDVLAAMQALLARP